MEHPSQYQKLDPHTSTNPGVASDATPRHLIIINWAMLICLLAIAGGTLALAAIVGGVLVLAAVLGGGFLLAAALAAAVGGAL